MRDIVVFLWTVGSPACDITNLAPDSIIFRGQSIWIRAPLLMLAAAAVIAGLYGRFKGLGTWPLGVDEFYISRSIDNVLRSGLPQFPCGGYYTRGLLYQYLVAGARMSGLSPELGARMISALSSLAVLPAAFLLARRIGGSLAGWLTVIMLCVSVWEIEMARFARMYAPFQAVFVWYLVYFLRFTVERQARALGYMAALSVLGVLFWEGGVLLGLANMLAVLIAHDDGRLRPVDWRRLASLLALTALLFLATRDLRSYGESPDASGAGVESAGHLRLLVQWLAPLRLHPVAACGWLLPAGFAIASWGFISSLRRRWMAALGLVFALAAAALHLFTLAGGVLILLLLAGVMNRRDWSEGRGRYFLLSLVGFFSFWMLFAVLNRTAAPGVVQYLFGLPSIYDEILRPWGRTMPILSVAIGLALLFWCYRAIFAPSPQTEPIRVLLALALVMAFAVGMTATDRIETRYTFFLYPLFIVLAVAAVLALIRSRNAVRPMPLLVAAALPLACFGATEDFQPRHVAAVDSAKINFRLDASPAVAAHYYPRSDMRLVGEWLAANTQPGDVVITGIPNLDQYYDRFDYFFLAGDDARYDSYVCRDGRTDRWTNHRLLYTDDALAPIVASGRRVYASLYSYAEKGLQADAQARGWLVTRVWTSAEEGSDVLLITMNAAHVR
jgi:Dolichyl-phosphate-mannose-protein mannosyltransferase